MLNEVVLIGRLVRDVELRYTQSETAVARFTLAVDRPFVNGNGEREADFIDTVVWEKLAEACAENVGKGWLVAVQGRLQVRSYDDSQGVRRKAAEVVARNVRFLSRPKDVSESTGECALEEDACDSEDIPF